MVDLKSTKTEKMKKETVAKEPKNKKEQKQEKSEALDERDKKITELTETVQRVQAEFENYRKRVERQNKEFVKIANEELINKLLPVLDHFESALKNTSDAQEFKKGVEMIYAQLFQTLEKFGLRPIKALNEKFDPYKHEALLSEKSDKDEIVLEELQKGYILNDRVIRHSKVKIGKK